MPSSVERGLVARLLLGAAGSRISLTGRSLVVGGKRDRAIPLAAMTAPPEVRPGRWWSTLGVTTQHGTEWIDGFSPADLQSLATQVNSGLREKARTTLQPGTAELADVRAQWDLFLATSEYLRDSRRRSLLERSAQAMSIARSPFWETHASGDQRRLAMDVATFETHSAEYVRQANERIIERELHLYSAFFDTIESKPLTAAQRRACVVNERCNLVLAGAGTGKTSTMIGRAGYLLASGKASADQLLMIAYGRKAAEEMQERQDSRLGALLNGRAPTIKTFHALGLEIIGRVEGRRPDITRLAEDEQALTKFIDEQIDVLTCNDEYARTLIRYCGNGRYAYRSPFDFASREEYDRYVREEELRTLNGDVVKSFEEVVVANWLSEHGVAFEYERAYEIDTADPERRQYKPDFYLPDYGVYIEHFALDAHGRPPAHFARYEEGVAWKRELHRAHGTTLVETHSHMQWSGSLEATLAARLTEAGVSFEPRSIDELLDELRANEQVSGLARLLGKVLTAFRDSDVTLAELRVRVSGDPDARRSSLLLQLFEPVASAYEAELRTKGEIDFGGMIRRAVEHVESGAYQSPFTHILVDEFQDISAGRARLVKALLSQRNEATLFAVGDDWQAIYRFAGSNIDYTTRFAHWFGDTATTALNLTFRFNDRIGAVASQFVQKNPSQMRKEIASLTSSTEPAVSLVRTACNGDGLAVALDAIQRRSQYGSGGRVSVLVLARYNFLLDEWRRAKDRRALSAPYPDLDIDFMTVHSAKGKEADYVIVIGMSKGKHGFPSEKRELAMMGFLLPRQEPFPFAEERRLFYVALTRARHRAYVVWDPVKPSDFITELLEGRYDVCASEFDAEPRCAEVPTAACPRCSDGQLVARNGTRGSSFYGCTNYPYCRHTEQGCERCGALPRQSVGKRVCPTPGCQNEVRACPECGGDLVEIQGKFGTFIGCKNYRGDSKYSCRYKERHVPKSA